MLVCPLPEDHVRRGLELRGFDRVTPVMDVVEPVAPFIANESEAERDSKLAFARLFRERRLDEETNVVLYRKPASIGSLHASTLGYGMNLPETYLIWRPGSLSDIITTCRNDREWQNTVEAEQWWTAASIDPHVRNFLSRFGRHFSDEHDVTSWLLTMQDRIETEISKELGAGVIFRNQQAPFGIAGAIPYTESPPAGIPLGRVNRKAAYVGKSDVFFKRGEIFWYAGFELKYFGGDLSIDDNLGWTQDSSFAQALCWLNGSRTTRFALILSDHGFKILYRKEIGTVHSEDFGEIPLFNFYCFPNGHMFCPMSDEHPDGELGRDTFLRIFYEILKTCYVRSRPQLADNVTERSRKQRVQHPFAVNTVKKHRTYSKRFEMIGMEVLNEDVLSEGDGDDH